LIRGGDDVRTVDTIIENASEVLLCCGPVEGLRGAQVNRIDTIKGGAVAIDAGRIVAVGRCGDIGRDYRAKTTIDAGGNLVTPGLVDPHSHLVYAGSRHDEWEFTATGRAAAAGLQGGIHRSVEWTRAATDVALIDQALADLDIIAAHGTTTLEAKSGYGLDRATELRLLAITSGLDHAVDIVTTFLGAHVPPREYLDDVEAYVDLVIDLLPQAAKFAEYCDVCCDPIGFSRSQCNRIAARARELGLGLRVHSDQTGDAEGGLFAAEAGAVSAEHADYTTDAGFRAMAEAGTAAVFFPGVTLHLMEMTPPLNGHSVGAAAKPFMPAVVRRAIDAGCVVALSTDYNPGSCPTPNMQTVMQLAARLFRLGYAEIWNMCTLNAAATLGRGVDRGSLSAGKRADIIIWSVPEHGMVINRFGVNLVRTVLIEGSVVVDNGVPVKDRIRSSASPGNDAKSAP
jgi:imidazolonepropionase